MLMFKRMMAKLNRKDIYPKNKQQTLHEITIYMLYLRIFFDSTRAIKRIPPSRAPAAVAPETTQSFSATSPYPIAWDIGRSVMKRQQTKNRTKVLYPYL